MREDVDGAGPSCDLFLGLRPEGVEAQAAQRCTVNAKVHPEVQQLWHALRLGGGGSSLRGSGGGGGGKGWLPPPLPLPMRLLLDPPLPA